MPSSRIIWLITDGKAGDLALAEGLAAALGGRIERRDVAPRRLWSLMAPYGPPHPAEDPHRSGSVFGPPHPDLVLAAGRRTVPVLRAFRRLPGRRPFTVFLRDPRLGEPVADFVWAPEHDGKDADLRIVRTLTAPHRFSAARLAALRAAPPPGLADLPRPMLGLLIGGNARGTRYSSTDIARFRAALAAALPGIGSVVATPSRRTPPQLAAAVRQAVGDRPGLFWDGAGASPLDAILALSDILLVTGDSHNMVSEALASGAPVHVLRPSRLKPRLAWFLDRAEARGLVRRFDGVLHSERQPPVDATPELAAAINNAYSSFRM